MICISNFFHVTNHESNESLSVNNKHFVYSLLEFVHVISHLESDLQKINLNHIPVTSPNVKSHLFDIPYYLHCSSSKSIWVQLKTSLELDPEQNKFKFSAWQKSLTNFPIDLCQDMFINGGPWRVLTQARNIFLFHFMFMF